MKNDNEYVPQIQGEELSENLAYLYPNIYDPTIKSLNFTPGYRGKRYKDKKINFGQIKVCQSKVRNCEEPGAKLAQNLMRAIFGVAYR